MEGVVTEKQSQMESRSWLEGMATFVQTRRLYLVLGIIGLYVVVFTLASYYKLELFGQGFDQVDYEQAIWNTAHGRWFEESRMNFTTTIFGVDFMPVLAVLVPFYMLIPSAHTLAVLQTLAIGAGAFAVYLLAKEKINNPFASVLFPIAYLVYPTVQFVNLSPIQPRAFALAFLLFAFYSLEKGYFWRFLALSLLAMATRTEVSLVVAMFGAYSLLTRKPWRFGIVPLIMGMLYFYVALFYIVPAFALPNAFATTSSNGGEVAEWSSTGNSLLSYYGHFGSTGGEIAKNIVVHPLNTLEVMFTADKIKYMALLLVPLGFLPLLRSATWVLVAPTLALNLLGYRSSQIAIRSHYQTLIVVGLVIGAVLGFQTVEKVLPRIRPRLTKVGLSRTTSIGLLLVLVVGLGSNLAMHNPVLSLVRYHESPARVRAAQELISMVPPDAPVAATSFVAPRLLPRRYIYNFPPASFSAPLAAATYIMADERGIVVRDKGSLDEIRRSGDWRQVAAKEGFVLFERVKK